MKKTLIIIAITLSIIIGAAFIIGCASCVKFPEKPYNKKTGTWLEPPECYEARICEYYRTQHKTRGESCKAEYNNCSKVRAAIRCMNEGTQKKMKKDFNDCFNLFR